MTARPMIGLAAVVSAWLGLASPSATAGEAVFTTSAGTFWPPVTSLHEAHFRTVVHQERDYSCGSAAVATLLSFSYDHPVSEADAFAAMFAAGDREAIQRYGFSLADMQRYLASLGFASDGYRVTLDKVAEVGVPAITLINTHGYSHFVVIKGIKDGDVLVGDPAAGLKAIPRPQFEAMWQNIVFVIHGDLASGQRHFNRPDEWMVRRKAPFDSALSRQGLATFATMMPGLFEFH